MKSLFSAQFFGLFLLITLSVSCGRKNPESPKTPKKKDTPSSQSENAEKDQKTSVIPSPVAPSSPIQLRGVLTFQATSCPLNLTEDTSSPSQDPDKVRCLISISSSQAMKNSQGGYDYRLSVRGNCPDESQSNGLAQSETQDCTVKFSSYGMLESSQPMTEDIYGDSTNSNLGQYYQNDASGSQSLYVLQQRLKLEKDKMMWTQLQNVFQMLFNTTQNSSGNGPKT